MWANEELESIAKMFLPPKSEIIVFEGKRKVLKLIDLDGDNILELVCAYYWQGEIYIMILKYYENSWHVLDVVKGKGYGITYIGACPLTDQHKNNLIIGWQVASIWSDLSVYELEDEKLKDLIKGHKYFSRIEVIKRKNINGKGKTCMLALWSHDTGKAYKVDIYKWENDKFVLALEAYPYYFQKVVKYYKRLLKEKNSTTYWYYLADAQIKIGKIKEACNSLDKALSFDYPYPSKEKLVQLKKQFCYNRQIYNKYGIDLSNIKYISSETKRDEKLEEAIIKAFNLNDNKEDARYYYNKVDLNDDGKMEVFVYLVGPFVCGTGGCTGGIFKKENGEYSISSRFSLVNNPIIISDKKTNGYKDIIMYVSGGGIESFFAELKYDGEKYPSNPSIQPKVEKGTRLQGIAIIANDISKEKGIKLKNSYNDALNNKSILDVKTGNVLGKYKKDKVILVGNYLNKDSSYVENVDIIINQNTDQPIIKKTPYSGYNLELFLGDFNGDNKEEIMLRGDFGGSGGYAIASVYEYYDNGLVEIFSQDMFYDKYKFSAKYLDFYKVLVNSITLKEKHIFDISNTPKIYLDMIYDKNGKVKTKEKPTISVINGAYPIKVLSKKNYYLFIRQRVIGINNANTIGYIESFVDLSNNEIKVIEMGAYSSLEKYK